MRRLLYLAFASLASILLFQPARAQVSITVSFGPPALPVYEQPPCPEEGFLWVPGYWAWDPDDYDYFWVPGTWVMAPEPGFLWTPPWWGWENGAYLFHDGYWGPEVGFYGGISYGFGYFGHGFEGGRWEGQRFFYNRSVTNVVNIRNVYNETVVNNVNVTNRVSYNGGEGGIQARPSPQEQAAERQRHLAPVSVQMQHRQLARSNPQLRAAVNQGKPAIAATVRPTEFSGHGAIPARSAGAPYHPPANRPAPGATNARPGANPTPPTHARDVPPHQPMPAPSDSNVDRKYQQQQQKMIEKQNQEHQKLQQQQQREDQRAEQQKWDEQRQQQMEQRHQQQTQQMEQRHTQQQQQQRPPERPQERPQPERPPTPQRPH